MTDTQDNNMEMIVNSIKNRQRLIISYNDKTRCIEPHRCGRSVNGKLLLRAVQIAVIGETTIAEWRLFDVEKIESCMTDSMNFVPRHDIGYTESDQMIPEVICEIND